MRTFLIIFGLGICFLTHRCQLTVNTPPYSQNELDLLLLSKHTNKNILHSTERIQQVTIQAA